MMNPPINYELRIDKEGYPLLEGEPQQDESQEYSVQINSGWFPYSFPLTYKSNGVELAPFNSYLKSTVNFARAIPNSNLYSGRKSPFHVGNYNTSTCPSRNNMFQTGNGLFCEDSDYDFRYNHPNIFSIKNKVQRYHKTHNKNKNNGKLKINVWEEFYYGDTLLDKKRFLPGMSNVSQHLYNMCGGYLPLRLIELMVWAAFFKMCFLMCYAYSLFWDLLVYVILKEHIKIHLKAQERNVKIDFVGNAFQGPYLVTIREIWCAHCSQQRRERSTLKMMRNYRNELCLNKK